MHFLRTKQLAQELGRGRLAAHELRKYCLAWAVLITAIAVGFMNEPKGGLMPDVAGVLEIVAVVLTLTVCFHYCYPKRFADYVAMMVCLAWPEVVKLMIAGSAAFLLLNPAWSSGASRRVLALVLDIVVWSALLAVCIRLVYYVRFVGSQRRARTNPEH